MVKKPSLDSICDLFDMSPYCTRFVEVPMPARLHLGKYCLAMEDKDANHQSCRRLVKLDAVAPGLRKRVVRRSRNTVLNEIFSCSIDR